MPLRLKTVMLSGAALSMLGTSAIAADVIPAPVNDWTGFYFGVGGGGSFSFSETDATGYGGLIASSGEGGIEVEDQILEDNGTEFGNADLFCTSSCLFGFANQLSIGDGVRSSETPEILGEIFDELNNFMNGGDDNDTGVAGAFGTVDGGFDYQVGSNFVVGLNAAFNFGSSSVDNSASGSGIAALIGGGRLPIIDNGGLGALAVGGGVGSLDTELELGNSWSVGGRAGFLVNESILLFASGGYISTKAELKASYSGGTAGLLLGPGADIGSAEVYANSSNDKWLNGYYIGGGVETLLTDHISFKMEYHFADLGSIKTSVDYVDAPVEDMMGPDGGYAAAAGVAAKADPFVHSIRATVSWRL